MNTTKNARRAWKPGMLRFLIAATLVSVLSFAQAAIAADGTFWGKNDNGKYDWSNPFYWVDMKPAGDGGYARFSRHQLDKLNQDVDGLELEAFENYGRWMTVTNKPITFVSSHSVLTRDNWANTGSHKPGFDVVLKGTGANALHITSQGPFHITPPAENFGIVRILGNTVHAWNTNGNCYTTGDFQLCEGIAHIQPQIAAGESANVSIATGEGTRFLYGPGLGRLIVDKGDGAAATLTIGTLERAPGGVMVVEASAGAEILGATEKVIVQNGAPTMTSGMCDASFVTRAPAAPYALSFLAYDSTDGFKTSSVTPVAFSSATSSDVALIDADTTISGTKQVHALYVTGERTITFEDDSVLQVGDGEHPAGIIFNAASDARIQPTLSGSNGTIDFGNAPGCIYFNNPRDNPTLTINPKISGSAGVTFSGGWCNSGSTSFQLAQAAGWTGPTVVTRSRLVLESPDYLPEDGDIYFIGGRDDKRSASLRIYQTMTFGENQRFHFSGWGWSEGYCYAVHIGGAASTITFSAPVELWGPVGFLQDSDVDVIAFAGGVTGGGISYWNCGTYKFTAPLEYTGRMNVKASSATIVFSGAGRPGSGTVEMPAAGTLRFEDLSAPYDFANDVTGGKGTLEVYGSEVRLTGKQTWAKIVLGAGGRVGLGADVSVADIVNDGDGDVFVLDGASPELHVSVSEGVRCAGDGFAVSNGVEFVKDGDGTLVLSRGAYISGAVTVADGTLKLDNSILNAATWRLDASDESTVTTNENGCATKWVSALGDGATFNTRDTSYVPGYTNKVNGLRTMTFQNDGSHYCRFDSAGSLRQKTIYACLAPNSPGGTPVTMSAWGWTGNSPEYGLRFEVFSGNKWGTLNYSASGLRQNGGTPYSFTPDGTLQIVGLIISDSDKPTEYPVSVGSYETWGAGKNFHGDICEVVGFDRVLDEADAKEVENALAMKWGLTNEVWHADVEAYTNQHISATADFALREGGILDLNGVDLTVASLSGAGVITNSSPVAATLTVTGTSTFAGSVCGNATLKTMASGTVLSLSVPDAAVEVAGGSASIAPYVYQPCTNGILYWLDAAWSPETTITTNADGLVTEVQSRGGTVKKFTSYSMGPVYVENALGGSRPAFQFTGPANSSPCLQTDSAVSTKTIVLVGQLVDDTYAGNYFWGKLGKDRGFRLNDTYNLDDGYNFLSDGWSFSCNGASIWTNGVKVTMAYGVDLKLSGAPYYMVVTRGESNTMTTYDNYKNGIGSYEKRACNMYLSEVIAYDHSLTDEEVRQVNEYIKAKWFDGDSVPSAVTAAFGPRATLAVTGGAAATLNAAETLGALKSDATGGTVRGDVTASAFIYDALGAQGVLPFVLDGTLALSAGATATVQGHDALETAAWPILSASARGENSEFATTSLDDDRRWRLLRSDATWRMVYQGATMIIFR